MEVFHAILKRIARFHTWFNINRCNLPLSLLFNYYYLPLSQARKLPILLYGHVKIKKWGGTIVINSDNIYRGMILINKDNESPSTSSGNTELILGGSKVIFHGPIKIGTGGRILTYGTSIVEFGRNIMINNNTVIGSCSKIKIGDNVVIASECMIFDTDFHFICDMETRIVNNCCSPVEIGDGTWLTNRAAVLKGSILPNKCIVGANCVVKGDYHDQPQGTTFVSSNTRIIDSKRCLVHSIENKLFDYYMDDPEMTYKITENIPELDTTT